jgi:hypothetical protein
LEISTIEAESLAFIMANEGSIVELVDCSAWLLNHTLAGPVNGYFALLAERPQALIFETQPRVDLILVLLVQRSLLLVRDEFFAL